MVYLYVSMKSIDGDISAKKFFPVQMNFIPIILHLFTILQLQFGFTFGYGQDCKNKLVCPANEICFVNENGKGICICQPNFIHIPENKTCSSPNSHLQPDYHPSSGLGIGLGITIIVVLLILGVGMLHRQYHILDGIMVSIQRVRRRMSRGSPRGQIYEVADDEDDVSPIV